MSPRLLSAVLAVALLAEAAPRKSTGLDRYVAAPDPSYRWSLVQSLPAKSVSAYLLEMTSQTWKPNDMNRGEWKHWLTIVKPAKVESRVGFLFITGGANDGRPRTTVDPMLFALAQQTGTAVAELRMVPNQPLTFRDDPAHKARVEDSFIAYTWRNYLKTGDETWPARLPMTKAAVRAMDTVTAFLASPEGGKVAVDRFFVSGASKRGWTTWTTAATDPRVVGFAPLVIDLLNVIPSFVHHYRAYGFWAPAVGDYYEQGLMDEIDNPKYLQLMKLVEPYWYRDRYRNQPKLLVNAAGDQFFLPDSWKFYWKDLPGEKHLRYVPNTDHSLRNSDAIESVTAFYDAVAKGLPRPRYSWQVAKDGTIEVKTTTAPTAVKLWQATNPEARDFRLETLGAKYTSTDLAPAKPGVYTAKPARPAKGFTAYFVEMTFPPAAPGRPPFKFTTGVVVTPDEYPFGPPVKGQTKIGAVPGRKR